MKKIAIISLGYLWFPCESGTSRFFQIANTFVDSGWEVDCITTSFQHFKKQPRDNKTIFDQEYPFNIIFIDAPAYKKNIDFRRIISNKVSEHNLNNYLKNNICKYDVIYVSIPANNIAAMVTVVAKENNIPVIVDVEDLWPEAMSMVIKNKRVRDLVLHSFLVDAEVAYRNASGIIGTSEDYTDRAFKNREKDIPAETVYVGCDIGEFDEGVNRFGSEIEKMPDEIWVTYAGSISTSYDIKTLIDAGYMLRDEKVHIQILGTGSQKDELEKYSEKMENIHFWGFTQYPKMAAVLSKSDMVVNSFIKGAPQSIVNKVGDYLASGKPMINTLENPVFCNLITDNNVGINVEPENAEALASTIKDIISDDGTAKKMGENARNLALKKFDRVSGYKKIVSMAEKIHTV